MAEDARQSAIQIATGVQVSNYGLNEPDRFYNGMLGEVVFKKLLDTKHKAYKYEPQHDGTDKEDFKVLHYNGKYYGVDVKTCSQPHYKYLTLPARLHIKHRYPLYVGIRLNGTIAEVMGYCLYHELKPITDGTMKVPSYGIKLDKLHDINNMLDKLAGKQVL